MSIALREAATRLLKVFDQQKMTQAERIIVGISDAQLRIEGNQAIEDLRAALEAPVDERVGFRAITPSSPAHAAVLEDLARRIDDE